MKLSGEAGADNLWMKTVKDKIKEVCYGQLGMLNPAFFPTEKTHLNFILYKTGSPMFLIKAVHDQCL